MQTSRSATGILNKVVGRQSQAPLLASKPFLRLSAQKMATQTPSSLHIENTNIKTAEGVQLDEHQKTIVGSVLDLFAGRPSLKKLSLWDDNATFEDPITVAHTRAQYAPQWYGLASVFSEVERLGHEVTSAGNPISMNMKTRYVVKGVNQEKTISSVINIFLDNQGKIQKLEDKWDGSLPDGSIKNAFRRLNANSVPHMVKVPKNDEEDHQMGFQ